MPLLALTLALAVSAAPEHLTLNTVVQLPDVLPLVIGLQAAAESHEPEVILDIDSPGGRVDIGLNLLGLMREVRQGGTVIICRVGPDAMAASMAAIIFVAGCSKREMAPTAALMFHEPALGEVSGKEGDLTRYVNSLADMGKRMAILVAPRLRMTAARYLAWIHDRDRWVSSDEARAMGLLE